MHCCTLVQENLKRDKYLLNIDTFRNRGAYRSGSSKTTGAFSVSVLAYTSDSFGLIDHMFFCIIHSILGKKFNILKENEDDPINIKISN